MKKMSIEDKLGTNRFVSDENSHIVVDKDYLDRHEVERLCRACPAGLYKMDPDGSLRFSHLGCLECGTCRVLSLGKVVQEWNYPVGGFGISYRMG
jgi:ferredoxin like protein